MERSYPGSYLKPSGSLSNTVLVDLKQGYIMSDVPYSISAYQSISDADWRNVTANTSPEPDIGIGRIFATRPGKLVQAIQQSYQQPLNLYAQTPPIHFFIGRDMPDGIDFMARFQKSMVGRLALWPLQNMGVYANETNTADILVKTLELGTMVSLWGGHATHKHITLNPMMQPQQNLFSTHIDTITETHPVLLTSLSCHSGLSISNFPNEQIHPHYDRSLVKSMMDSGITVFAPSSFAYMLGEPTEPNLHELMVTLWNNNLLYDTSAPTIGDVWKSIFPIYHSRDPGLTGDTSNPASRLYHIAGAYGIMLYGLPTQPIERPIADLCSQPVLVSAADTTQPAADLAASMSTESFTLDVEIPYIDARQQPDGSTLFSILSDGTHMVPPSGYILPEIVRTLELPANRLVTSVELTSSNAQPYTQSVRLSQAALSTSTGNTLTPTNELPPVYPSQLYTYTVTPQPQGSLLTLSIVPMHYISETQQVTLYRKLSFEVDTLVLPEWFPGERQHEEPQLAATAAGATTTSFDSFQFPESIHTNQQVPMDVQIDFSESETVKLAWDVKENGQILSSGFDTLVSQQAGVSSSRCTIDTTGWSPGMKEVHLSLQRSNGQEKKLPNPIPIEIKGLGIKEAEAVSQVYPEDATHAHWYLTVYDEQGMPKDGLGADDFAVEVGGATTMLATAPTPTPTPTLTPVGLTDSTTDTLRVEPQAGPGTYKLDYALDAVPPGTHQVRISVKDADGNISGWHDWTLTREASTPTSDPTPGPTPPGNPIVYLPVIEKAR
jgi:hypothetical protein